MAIGCVCSATAASLVVAAREHGGIGVECVNSSELWLSADSEGRQRE